MAIPGEHQASQNVTSAPSNSPFEELSGLLAVHGEAFARIKRLGMRSNAQGPDEQELEYCSHERGEMAEGYAALRALVHDQLLLKNGAGSNDLEDAIAALDAINPGSPEWGPTFLQFSELVEARLHQDAVAIASPC